MRGPFTDPWNPSRVAHRRLRILLALPPLAIAVAAWLRPPSDAPTPSPGAAAQRVHTADEEPVYAAERVLDDGTAIGVALPMLRDDRVYSVTIRVPDIDALGGRALEGGALRAQLLDPSGAATGKELNVGDPDLAFLYRPRAAGASTLRLQRLSTFVRPPMARIADRPQARERDGRRDLATLFDDDATLLESLTEGDAVVQLSDTGAFAGRHALTVTPMMKAAGIVPGWRHEIVENPGPGQYRWLRFAWRKQGGSGIALQLADEGTFRPLTDPKLRYYAGATAAPFAATTVGETRPDEWTVVTRDLFAEGGAFTLTGIAFAALDGERAWFDQVLLARTPADFARAGASATVDGELPRMVAVPPPPLPPADVGTFASPLRCRITIHEVATGASGTFALETEPNDDWQRADELRLGTTVFGGGDDVEYLDHRDEGRTGFDWFTFTHEGPPKLVFFELDLRDRDVPCSIEIHHKDADGRLVPYRRGKDPTEVRHDNQDDDLVGFKMITRVVAEGRYWLRVKANHPVYALRTTLHPIPPFDDPRQATRVALDYSIKAGDSFFSNVPRNGAVRTRVQTNSEETQRCFACHPGHYPMIANLHAAARGYRVDRKPQFQYLVDRLYDVPVPFYGHGEDVTWARFDLAPQTGIGRVGNMLAWFEERISGRPTDLVRRTAGFGKLVYGGRDTLPTRGDKSEGGNAEFDGNRPISDARVATDTWRLFHTIAQREADSEIGSDFAQWSERMKTLLPTARIKDLEDVVEQTIGYAEMDPVRFRDEIAANVARIKARVHHDGGFVTGEYMTNLHINDGAALDALARPELPSSLFFTAAATYALVKAGVPADDEIVRNAVTRLLGKQQEYGGFVDPVGELFKTPYLETKWVAILFSELFPELPEMARRTPLGPPPNGDDVPRLLAWLDRVFDIEDSTTVPVVLAALRSPLPQVRQMGATALGRIAWNRADTTPLPPLVAPLVAALGDESKQVARVAAWALRQFGNVGVGRDAIADALQSDDVSVRRAASRIFRYHFFHMDREDRFLDACLDLAGDADPVVRLQATQSLSRWWYRRIEPNVRGRIVARLLDRSRAESVDWVRGAVEKALHDVLDENTLEFYANWLRVLGTDAARERAKADREVSVERALATQLADALSGDALSGDDVARRGAVLRAIGWRTSRGVVNGNDIDDVQFYDVTAARTLVPGLLRELRPGAPLREAALFAARALLRAADDALVVAVASALEDDDVKLREIAAATLQTLHPAEGPASDALVDEIVALLAHPAPEARRGALAWIKRDERLRDTRVGAAVRALARDDDVAVRRLCHENLAWLIADDVAAADALRASLGDEDVVVRALAFTAFAAQTKGPFTDPARARAFALAALAGRDPEVAERAFDWLRPRRDLLPDAERGAHLQRLVQSRRPSLRRKAAEDLVALHAAMPDDAVVREGLEIGLKTRDAEVRKLCAAALGIDPTTLPGIGRAVDRAESTLDFSFFTAFVNPVLTRPTGIQQVSCVSCHDGSRADVGTFRLVAASDEAFTEHELIRNYNAVVALANAADPDASLLLRKPLNPDPAIGALHGTSHGGGVAWSGPTDPDFAVLRRFLNGAKMDNVGLLDFPTFRERIVPLFLAKGPDGDTCWECHSTHNILYLPEPSGDDGYTVEEARIAFESVLRVVDLDHPDRSLLLQKPLAESREFLRGAPAGTLTHQGGVRWPEGAQSKEWRDLAEWIRRGTGR